ncbi:MAG: Gfo/Idh/MocA family oxidoreductase [Rhodococcus sp. (in: high G+C Gram-positive bacteria)]
MTAPIRVGIVGVSAERGWAATAHIPALRALPAYEITALSTTRQTSADAAGRAFGVASTFEGHEALVHNPDVDLVVVTVKVPHHRDIVTAALDAGKAVYCEWPLGRDLEQARAMTDHADRRGVRTLIGLQSRRTPAILHLRNLIAHGYVGTVLSTTMVGSSALGGFVDQGNAYTLDRGSAANVLTIAAGHSMDAMGVVLGEFDELSAVLDTRRPDITVLETGEQRLGTSPDQLGVVGRLKSGAIASIHFREGHEGGTGFLWEINGTEGTLQLRADSGHPGMFALTVSGSRGREALTELPVPAAYERHTPGIGHLDAMAAGVARIYDAYERDIRSGANNSPDFTQALPVHRLIATIEQAAVTGQRTTLIASPG